MLFTIRVNGRTKVSFKIMNFRKHSKVKNSSISLQLSLLGALSSFCSWAWGQQTKPSATNSVLAEAGFKVKDTKSGGGGAYGGNRRVFTKDSGYQGIEGVFSMPQSFYLGDEYVADGEERGTDGRPETPGSNPRQNKPTFYFGADGHNFNLEVGFQYEGLFKDGLDAGWSAYSSITLTYAPSQGNAETVGNWYQSTLLSNRQQQQAGKLVPAKIIIQADGSITSALGAFAQPQTRSGATPNIYPAITRPDGQVPKTSIKVRRVIGMTQKTGLTGDDEGDGSYVRGVGFTQGHLYRWSQSGSTPEHIPWSTGDHNYAPEHYNVGHETAGPDGGPIFVVNSDAPWNRLVTGKSRPDNPLPAGANHTRYFQESVSINLLTKPGDIKALPKKLGRKSK